MFLFGYGFEFFFSEIFEIWFVSIEALYGNINAQIYIRREELV